VSEVFIIMSGRLKPAPPRAVLAGDENESDDLDGDTGEAEDCLCRDGVKQGDGGDSDEKAGRHEEKSREFH
jgi:hypothetical protein